jgi:hypothetical protein
VVESAILEQSQEYCALARGSVGLVELELAPGSYFVESEFAGLAFAFADLDLVG